MNQSKMLIKAAKSLIGALLFLLCSHILYAQKTDTVVTAKVVGNPSKRLIVSPANRTLLDGRKHKFKLKLTPKGKISRIDFKGGRALLRDSVVELQPQNTEMATLSVYELLKNGKERLIETIQFKVVKVQPPTFYLNNVKMDSVMELLQLMAGGRLEALVAGFDRNDVAVQGFEVVLLNNDSNRFDTLRSNSPWITTAMLDRFGKLKPGQVLTFERIKVYFSKTGHMLTFGPARFYLNKTRPRQFSSGFDDGK